MKVVLLTGLSLATGSFEAGDVVELEDRDARGLIEAGLAEARKAEPEAAMLGDAPEQAVLPRARARG